VRKRDSLRESGHAPHRLRTTLTPAQEAAAVCLRTTLVLPPGDLLAVVREALNLSRSGLDRHLRRRATGRHAFETVGERVSCPWP